MADTDDGAALAARGDPRKTAALCVCAPTVSARGGEEGEWREQERERGREQGGRGKKEENERERERVRTCTGG